MKLAVPTLVNYDGLARLVASAETGSLTPTGYIIVDNSGKLLSSASYPSKLSIVADNGKSLSVITPGKNIGVAAAWNRILDLREPVIIANDDITLGTKQFEEMARDLASHPFVGNGWCLFGQTPECTDRVGFYDENFYPAYYEDSDYSARMARAGVERYWGCSEPVNHSGCWTTSALLGHPEWIGEAVEKNRRYFVEKWGCMPPEISGDELFTEPFNGNPPPGWSLRC